MNSWIALGYNHRIVQLNCLTYSKVFTTWTLNEKPLNSSVEKMVHFKDDYPTGNTNSIQN